MSSFGERLLEERERLDLSQPALADACRVTMRSQRNYEKNERSPDATYLTAIAATGADVLYILTGQRSFTPPPALPDLGTIELAVEYVRNREQLEKRKLTAVQFAKAVRLAYQITLEEQTAGPLPGGETRESTDGSRKGKRSKTT